MNAGPLLAFPDTVTTTGPLVAPAGTVVEMLVSLQLVGVAVVPLKVTVLDPWVSRKYEPLIVTLWPTDAAFGVTVVMLGDGVTVKVTPLLAVPPTVTVTGPVAAVVGTGASMAVAFQLVGVLVTPLNLTMLDP